MKANFTCPFGSVVTRHSALVVGCECEYLCVRSLLRLWRVGSLAWLSWLWYGVVVVGIVWFVVLFVVLDLRCFLATTVPYKPIRM